MINVAAPGLYSSIQDLGRFGYRALGVPVGGAMDAVSAKHANALLGNPPGCAVLECTALGPTLEFSRPALLAFSGAGFELKLNGRGLSTATPFMVESGTALKIGTAKQGMRGYLAVLGGFTSETALGSQSWYEGVTVKKMLQKNDRLFFGTPKEKPQGTTGLRRILKKIPPIKKTAVGYKKDTIEVYPGPEFYMLPEKSKAVLLGAAFTILPQSNRMGYYLETTTVVGAAGIITAPVQPGTVQLTPSGKVIALMRDAQTTGGYSRIFQLSERAICVLSQKRGGAGVGFRLLV